MLRRSGGVSTLHRHSTGRRSTNTYGASYNPNLPSTIANLTAWQDAVQITGQSDNTLLSSWPTMVNSPTWSFQQSGTFRPTYYSTTAGKTVNGHPAVWFSGAQAMFVTPVQSSIAQPVTLLCVAGLASTAGTQVIFDSDSGTAAILLELTGSNWVANAGSALTGPAADTNAHLFAIVANGASSQLIVDGAATNGALGAQSCIYLTTGFNRLGANPMTGFICELALYTGVMSGTNLTAWHSYSQAKWGTA
jgi:hypothetical protein